MGCCDRVIVPYYRGNSGEIFIGFPSTLTFEDECS